MQASLLFLQKKSANERNIAHEGEEDCDVFMAIAEKLGKDRRGNPIYLRDEDGAEIIFPVENKYVAYRPEDGKPIVKTRVEKQRMLDDDLPKISKAYLENLNN